ncbi:exported hypothetical protein [Candidatus Zixiibacteriota bacterium]|nr:exported hypothetical protein [candidate division Zixibacteria bacterium]
MKKLLLLILLSLILIQCGPAPMKELPGKEETAPPPCTPENLVVRPGNQQVLLKWETNCPRGVILSGYNIYLLEDSLKQKDLQSNAGERLKPYNAEPYPGDTNPERGFETITINNLRNGADYYFLVRTVFPDGMMSGFSNQVGAICRPEGEFTLAFRYSDLNDGFSFARGESVRADASANDLYFFEKDGFAFLASPSRLNGFLRKSKFYSLGKTTDIYQYQKFDIDIPSEERIPILAGESYLVKTADGNFAKIRIEEISGKDRDRVLKIKYIYQTIRNLIRF